MNFLGSKSEWCCMMQLRSFILICALSIPVLVLSLVPRAWGGESKRDIVMMVDNSGSMKKNDPEFLARHALKAFISDNGENTHLALITFDHNVNLAVPLTPLSDTSRPILLDAVQEIDYSGLLTNSPAALERAIYEIALHGREDADKSIIFITDGIVDTGNKVRDKQQENWMLEELSTLASNLDIKIFGIAFAEAANYQLIQNLVFKTGGDHFKVLRAEDLASVFDRLEEIYRPASTPLPKESEKPEVALNIQPPSDLNGETQIVDKNEILPETIKNEALNEIIVTEDPLIRPERLAQSRSDSMPKELLNRLQHFFANKEVMIFSVLFICLVVLSAFFILRKKRTAHRKSPPPPSRRRKRVPRQMQPRSVQDSSVREDQEKALLIDVNHFTSQRNHPLSKKITRIGRVDTGRRNDTIHHLLIDKPTIGREHALIEYEDDGYWLVDRDSTNGTFIDGKRVRGKVQLKNGNRICFHDIEFIFSIPGLNKFEKTVSVPIASSREEGEHENRYSPLTPSEETTRNINEPHFNINSTDHSQDKTWVKSAKRDEEYTHSVNKPDLRKRGISDDAKESRPTRRMSNRVDPKRKSKMTSEVKSHSRNKGDTEILSDTKLPPFSSTDEPAQESRQVGIEKTEVMLPSQNKGNATDPIDSIAVNTPDLDVTQLSPTPNTDKPAQESGQASVEKTQVMPSAQTKKETKDPMESIRENTLELDTIQPPPISDPEKHAQKLKKSDTEKIPQDVLDLMFKPEQNKNDSP